MDPKAGGKNKFNIHVFRVSSIYGAKSKEPIVRIQYSDFFDVMVAPGDARDLASNLLQSAEAAEVDAFLVEFIAKVTDKPVEESAIVLQEFREWRSERQR